MGKRLVRIVYLVIYYLVQGTIYIGDTTRFILFLPLRFLNFIVEYYFLRFVKLTVHNISFSFLVVVGIATAFIQSVKIFRKKTFDQLDKVKVAHEKKQQVQVPKKRRRKIPLFLRFKYYIFGLVTTFVVVSVYQSYVLVRSLPSPKSIGKYNYSLSTHITDRNGRLLYEFYREQNRTPIKVDELPRYVYEASIAFEDKNFFKHNGISLYGGIVRALKEMAVTKSVQGGSTITQQLVKSALLTPERTIERKIKEIILALWTERLYTKRQILQMYLNQVPYGGSAYGIEEASRSYFDKHAKDLTIDEAALLAGLPQSPSVYSPFVNPGLAIRRRNEVLKKMFEQKYVTKNQYDNAIKRPLSAITPKTPIKSPHFVLLLAYLSLRF